MNAPDDNTAAKGLRGWWASPPRTGIRRTIAPWEYRHLRASGVTRMACGAVLAVGGILFLSYGSWWAAPFLVLAALNIGGGYWYTTMARANSART